ncbi:MAG TPA: PilZ domain-containing protein [Myxococcota bacterium]|nr:PilZ domain-containing protein [Myxococcota bacterium]HRY96688.1 PilZ domain-containing protein [Myxococcota bacterium]HSA20574.1 PilZ domain-containing protein [Myxococcota bacterium]
MGGDPKSPVAEPVPVDPQDRRRSRRIQMEAIVHYQVGGSEFINLATNISSDGIFIKNFAPPPVGSEIRLRVTLPAELGGVPVHLVGRVVRVVDSAGMDQRGMGVEFTSVMADTPEAVRLFVHEIYELNDLAQLEPERDESSGRYRYLPRPQDTLRLQAADTGRPALEPEQGRGPERYLVSALLVLVGALVGGGLVFLVLAG